MSTGNLTDHTVVGSIEPNTATWWTVCETAIPDDHTALIVGTMMSRDNDALGTIDLQVMTGVANASGGTATYRGDGSNLPTTGGLSMDLDANGANVRLRVLGLAADPYRVVGWLEVHLMEQ